jgi:two-component system LytT family response regulator
MKAIIVDDEPMARMALRSILKMHFPQVEVLAECKNVPEAVKQINDLRPQVVFLDIEMPEYTGFDLLNFFRPEHIDFEIIFVTAYNEYALRAFEISAVDYLLKPLQVEQLERALKRLKVQPDTRKYEVLKENINSAEDKKIVLQNTESAFVVQISDIVFLEAQGSYTNVVTHSHPDILISKKISHFDFLEQLPSFFRSHRSYLINLQHVKRINKKDFTIEMDNQRSAYLAQDRKNTLLEALGR